MKKAIPIVIFITQLIIAILLVVLIGIAAKADPLKVAVIDTGLIPSAPYKLCNEGKTSKSLIDYETLINEDNHPHGTNIVGIIEDNLDKDADYCFVIYKALSFNLKGNFFQALEQAYNDDVDVINISGGGYEKDKDEETVIKKLLDKGVVIIAAAGNNRVNFDDKDACVFYPACLDKRIIVVGKTVNTHTIDNDVSNRSMLMSNFLEAKGTDICARGICESGTSQATAVVTSNIVRTILMYRHKNGAEKCQEQKNKC